MRCGHKSNTLCYIVQALVLKAPAPFLTSKQMVFWITSSFFNEAPRSSRDYTEREIIAKEPKNKSYFGANVNARLVVIKNSPVFFECLVMVNYMCFECLHLL